MFGKIASMAALLMASYGAAYSQLPDGPTRLTLNINGDGALDTLSIQKNGAVTGVYVQFLFLGPTADNLESCLQGEECALKPYYSSPSLIYVESHPDYDIDVNPRINKSSSLLEGLVIHHLKNKEEKYQHAAPGMKPIYLKNDGKGNFTKTRIEDVPDLDSGQMNNIL